MSIETLANKRLWLRSDFFATQVDRTYWQDASGLDNHATLRGTTLPEYVADMSGIAGPAMHLSGAGDFTFATNPMAGATEGEMWIALRTKTNTAQGSWAFGADTGSGDYVRYADSAYVWDNFGRPTNRLVYGYDNSADYTSWHVYRVTVSPTAGLKMWLDGKPLTMDGAAATAYPIAWAATARLGRSRRSNADYQYFTGYIGEVLQRSVISTDLEAADILSEMAERNGVSSFLTPFELDVASGGHQFVAGSTRVWFHVDFAALHRYQLTWGTDAPSWTAFTGYYSYQDPAAPKRDDYGGIAQYYPGSATSPVAEFSIIDGGAYIKSAALVVGRTYALSWTDLGAFGSRPFTLGRAQTITTSPVTYDALPALDDTTDQRWYRWTCPVSGEYEFTAHESWGYAEIYTGSTYADYDYLGYFQSDEAGVLMERYFDTDDYAFHAEAGTSYFLVVYLEDDTIPLSQLRQITWSRLPDPPAPPVNDERTGAISVPMVTGVRGSLTYNDSGATMGPEESPGSIWYVLPAVTENTELTVRVVPSAEGYSKQRFVSINKLNADNTVSWLREYATLLPGTTYYILIERVYDAPGGYDTGGLLEWASRPAVAEAPNSIQATAQPLPIGMTNGSTHLDNRGPTYFWYALDVVSEARHVWFSVPTPTWPDGAFSPSIYSGTSYTNAPALIPAGAQYWLRMSSNGWGNENVQLDWISQAPAPGLVTPRALASDEQIVPITRSFPDSSVNEVYTLTITAPEDGAFTFAMKDLPDTEAYNSAYGTVTGSSGFAQPIPLETDPLGGVLVVYGGELVTIKITLPTYLRGQTAVFGWGWSTNKTWHPWRDTMAFLPHATTERAGLRSDGTSLSYDPMDPWDGGMYDPQFEWNRDYGKHLSYAYYPNGKHSAGGSDFDVGGYTSGFYLAGDTHEYATFHARDDAKTDWVWFVWTDAHMEGLISSVRSKLLGTTGTTPAAPNNWSVPHDDEWLSLGSTLDAEFGADANGYEWAENWMQVRHLEVNAKRPDNHGYVTEPVWKNVYSKRPLFENAEFHAELGFPELAQVDAMDASQTLDARIGQRLLDGVSFEWSEPDTETIKWYWAIRIKSERQTFTGSWPGATYQVPPTSDAFSVSALVQPAAYGNPQQISAAAVAGTSLWFTSPAPVGAGLQTVVQTPWIEVASVSMNGQTTQNLGSYNLAAGNSMVHGGPGGTSVNTAYIKQYEGAEWPGLAPAITGGSKFDSFLSMHMAACRIYPPQFRIATFERTVPFLGSETTDEPLVLRDGQASVADAGEYSYMGDVGVGVAPPVLWFVYQKWGFLGQHFVAYGHGLGDTQPELNGKFYLGAGPPSKYPVAGEFRPSLDEWARYPAGPNAYDGSQVQFPGTSVAPPKVDTEHQIIEFIVPGNMPLTEPTEYHIYVVNDHGMSNALSLILYPMIDVNMEAADPLLLTVTAGMGVFDTPETFEGPTLMAVTDSPLLSVLPQNYSRISAPWVLTGRVPERAPAFLTTAKAAFALTGGTPATGLDDPVSSALSVPLRYRPLDSKVAARPDLGTGMSAWNSNESSSMDFKWHYLSAPYVDAENVVASRNGPIVRPAMAFPGGAWAESTASFPTGPKMVFAMAVTIFPHGQARSYLLSSFIAGAVDPDSFPLGLYIEGDVLTLVIGAKLQTTRIAPGYIGRRPVIIAFTLNDTALTYVVASDKATMRTLTHPKLTAGGLRLYLGRNNNAAQMQTAIMDILDMGIDHTAAATTTRLWSIVNRLDGIYGVMK